MPEPSRPQVPGPGAKQGPDSLTGVGASRRPGHGKTRTTPIVDLTELVSRLEAAALEAADLSTVLARAARAEMDRAGLMADLAAVLKGER